MATLTDQLLLPPEGSSGRRNTYVLAALRVAIGILFLIFGEYKVFGTQFTLGGGFQHWINLFLQNGGTYPFMVPVLKNFVLPHATAIAFLVAYGEFAIGLALVFGILVRTASCFGFIYMLALLFSANFPGPNVAFWQYFGASLEHLVLALCFATFAISDANRVLSIGRVFRRRRAARTHFE
jgi:thiosulfate dehydrogenase [quinone] large subunit